MQDFIIFYVSISYYPRKNITLGQCYENMAFINDRVLKPKLTDCHLCTQSTKKPINNDCMISKKGRVITSSAFFLNIYHFISRALFFQIFIFCATFLRFFISRVSVFIAPLYYPLGRKTLSNNLIFPFTFADCYLWIFSRKVTLRILHMEYHAAKLLVGSKHLKKVNFSKLGEIKEFFIGKKCMYISFIIKTCHLVIKKHVHHFF